MFTDEQKQFIIETAIIFDKITMLPPEAVKDLHQRIRKIREIDTSHALTALGEFLRTPEVLAARSAANPELWNMKDESCAVCAKVVE